MHKFYGIPGGAAGGMSDSKVPDMQAGWEQGIINALTGLSGLNMIYESVGMYASLMGFSPEGMVLGNDLIGQTQRCVRGIDVTEDALSLDVMKAVCLDGGPGHYLGSDQTLALMQTEYLYPEIGNRLTPKDWVEAGKPDLIEAARRRMDSILQSAPCQVPAVVDRAIRARFPIRF
jgi:trimethylamine--corrinoid protein Co-methyltransferase